MTKTNKHYAVMSPVYEDNYYYNEPPETVEDWVTVDAPNKRLAKAAGLKEMRRKFPHGYWSGRDNPFVGLTVLEICPHDMDLKEAQAGWCEECGGPGPCLADKTQEDPWDVSYCGLLKNHDGDHNWKDPYGTL
jgi:hypothetical protein